MYKILNLSYKLQDTSLIQAQYVQYNISKEAWLIGYVLSTEHSTFALSSTKSTFCEN